MIFFDEKILLIGIEDTYGTAPTLNAASGVLARNIRIMPMEGQDLSRELELPEMGAQGTIRVDLHAKISFEVELVGSGTAGTPPTAGKLLCALGCAETIVASTSVTYNPVSRNHESVAASLSIGSTRFFLTGAHGTGTLRVNASGIPVIAVELTGLWNAPAEHTPINPDLDDQMTADILAASAVNTPTFTINSVPMVMSQFALNLGNRVEARFRVGSDRILITGRQEMIETTVEAVALTTLNPFALAQARTLVPVTLVHGTQAGNICTISAPKAQMQRPTGIEEQQGIAEWPLSLVPQRTNGNDQFTIAFT